MNSRSEMLDLVVVDGRARGIVTRDMVTGEIRSHAADAIALCIGGYGNVYYLSTNAKGCNTTAIWRAYKRGAALAVPSFTQIHPTCIPVSGKHQSKLTLMSESLRNDGRILVPRAEGDRRHPTDILEAERDYYLERRSPSFGNLSLAMLLLGLPKPSATGAAGSAPAGWESISTLRPRSNVLARRPSASGTGTSSTCTVVSRTKGPTRRRCASTLPFITSWAGSGWITA